MKVLKNILDWLGISIFLALLCVVVLQIIARSVLTISIPWTEELSRFLFIWLTYIGAAIAARKGSNIVIDMLIQKIPNNFRKASEIVIILCSMAVVVVFLVGSWNLIEKTKGVYYSTMPFLSTGWQYAAPVVGFGLILFYFILRLVSIVTGKPIATVKGLDLEEAGKEANE